MECPRCFFSADDAVDEARCRKCGRSYRPSVNVYLGLVALVYIVFVRYFNQVLTGAPLGDMQTRPMYSALQPFLYHWGRWPVDIQMRPALILVLGVMLAVLVFVPIMMSVLYGKRGGFFLAAIASVLGPINIFGAGAGISVMLFLSVWIAGGWTLRLPTKIGSVLLACLPVWVFFLLYSRAPANVPLPTAYYVPALITVALCLGLAVVLFALMRVVTYNVRWAGIVLSVLCLLPIVSYKLWVGEDGIEYALLERDYGINAARFPDVTASQVVEKFKEEYRKEQKKKEDAEKEASKNAIGGREPIKPDEDEQRDLAAARLSNRKLLYGIERLNALKLQQATTLEACERFLERFPESRHKSDVLYMMICAGDMNLDIRALSHTGPEDLLIRHDWSRIREPHDGVPCDTRELCRRMIDECGDTGYAVEAMVKLADYAAYRGDLDAAMAMYDAVIKEYTLQNNAALEDEANLSVFSDLYRVGDLRLARYRQRFIDRWYRVAKGNREFLVQNRGCPHCHDAQLKAYLAIPAFQIDQVRRKNLNRILAACPKCKLVDNVACDLARMEGNLTKRMEAFIRVADEHRGTDGAAEALLSLIEMECQLANREFEQEGKVETPFSLDDIEKSLTDQKQIVVKRAAAYYERLAKEHRESYTVTGWATLFYSSDYHRIQRQYSRRDLGPSLDSMVSGP